jgi:hypothetical protein
VPQIRTCSDIEVGVARARKQSASRQLKLPIAHANDDGCGRNDRNLKGSRGRPIALKRCADAAGVGKLQRHLLRPRLCRNPGGWGGWASCTGRSCAWAFCSGRASARAFCARRICARAFLTRAFCACRTRRCFCTCRTCARAFCTTWAWASCTGSTRWTCGRASSSCTGCTGGTCGTCGRASASAAQAWNLFNKTSADG